MDGITSPRLAAFPEQRRERAWLAWQWTLLIAAAIGMLWLFQVTDLDRRVAYLFFDVTAHSFPLRHTWLFEDVLHRSAKVAAYLGVAGALYFCYLGWRGELEWLPPRNATLAALGMLLIPLGAALLKQLISRHCPWDMTEFGGYAPYLHLLDTPPSDMKAGVCFPAGHASAGFLWVVWGLALRPAGRPLARLGLLAGVVVGGLLGAARMAQGAHFLSHTLWSLWFAWALSLALAWAVGADLRIGSRRRAATSEA